MRDGFNDFLKSKHSAENQLPQTVQELANRAGIRLVVADAKDPEMVGFVQWRVAFYVSFS